ncbi:hypothetical protein Xvie_01557 [Xenorhabdus vietnamensis]|uniref:Uncharacterized protein n=1 Tax=Xenorhabdus vietnamensis TaxID=351656 RepID=A0A1Y2SDY9_9GAMM|nr:hypothetical protein Xvie_01557 [Xenorhabdus vietnamensis]
MSYLNGGYIYVFYTQHIGVIYRAFGNTVMCNN